MAKKLKEGTWELLEWDEKAKYKKKAEKELIEVNAKLERLNDKLVDQQLNLRQEAALNKQIEKLEKKAQELNIFIAGNAGFGNQLLIGNVPQPGRNQQQPDDRLRIGAQHIQRVPHQQPGIGVGGEREEPPFGGYVRGGKKKTRKNKNKNKKSKKNKRSKKSKRSRNRKHKRSKKSNK